MSLASVQELLTKEFFTEDEETQNEMLELLEFMRLHGVPLTNEQVKAIFILKEFELEDIANFVLNSKQFVTPTEKYMNTINKITLADRIKGNAKLSSILKANANPLNEYQKEAKQMRREL